MREERLKQIVIDTNKLTAEDLVWRSVYPNNIPENGERAVCSAVFHENADATYSGRKYTIVYQYKEVNPGSGLVDPNEIELYILFEKCYFGIADIDEVFADGDDGQFVRAYSDMETAKARAVTQYKAVFGYALAHIASE